VARPTPTPAGVPSDNTTLVAVLQVCADAGFSSDFFVTEEARIRCGSCHQDGDPRSFELLDLRRVEGASDPADMAAVLCLECPRCEARGTAVVRYGPEALAHEEEVLSELEDRRA
jgi:hypothetical protein